MKIEKTKIDGLYIIKPKIFNDNRGRFVKIFNSQIFNEFGLDIDFLESYYSISKKNVIRGMHFQTPPDDNNKLVYVPAGKITDVILDIRKKTKTFGEYVYFELSCDNGHCVYIPQGCAHGFLSLENNTNVTYMQTTMYSKEHDKGIRFDSFGIDWKCENPILSERDKQLPKLDEYKSLF